MELYVLILSWGAFSEGIFTSKFGLLSSPKCRGKKIDHCWILTCEKSWLSGGHWRSSTILCLCCCDLHLWQLLMTGQFFSLGSFPGPSKIYLTCMRFSWWCSANTDYTWADHPFRVSVVYLTWFGAVRGFVQEVRGIALISLPACINGTLVNACMHQW